MNKATKKISLIIILLAVMATIIALFLIKQRHKVIIATIPKYYHSAPDKIVPPASNSSIINLKSSILLPVPFTPQAPTGNWDKIHNEDCEEASVIMAAVYFGVLSPSSPIEGRMPNGQERLSKLDPVFVEQQLTKLTDWEMASFGYNLDINSEEVVKMITANYSLQTKIIKDFTEETIKKELAQNHLVLLPANGRLLGNPNYKQPGPKYHMLVLRGYTTSSIITNDPGTKNGQNYPYSFDTLYNANGNWDHDTNKVDLTRKNIIVVWK